MLNLFEFYSGSNEFNDLLGMIKKDGNTLFWLGINREFSEIDFEELRFFILGINKEVRESVSDRDKNNEYTASLPSTKTYENFSIKMVDKHFLSKQLNLKSNYFCILSYDRNNNYIITESVRDIFIQEKVIGLEYLPLYKNDEEFHQGYYHIFTRSIMPPVEINNLTTRIVLLCYIRMRYNILKYIE